MLISLHSLVFSIRMRHLSGQLARVISCSRHRYGLSFWFGKTDVRDFWLEISHIRLLCKVVVHLLLLCKSPQQRIWSTQFTSSPSLTRSHCCSKVTAGGVSGGWFNEHTGQDDVLASVAPSKVVLLSLLFPLFIIYESAQLLKRGADSPCWWFFHFRPAAASSVQWGVRRDSRAQSDSSECRKLICVSDEIRKWSSFCVVLAA